ncbi:PTS system N-acetylgalactosamine-specific EIIB component (Man family) [Melghirimyces profundicolus]|uniref:PTS system N-acetylgalactosamine-specific EIIB component (Man family) n=1 Tax=Melghirimyces profundicolus TaxID=1242148 RepID=A0A2T6BD32_9BACL|nr:PTS N-acetylgalactosamine transporter subunit IIB [Melghirimyces profundicolus]PTX53990.1 PTS system N-acetylgalactosamine-specific EIIB component (Man family) [Melghirimyces profundicolus]
MPNILLTRIDNRLIHGQVAVTWSNHVGANLIVVANDEVAGDSIQQSLMDMAVSGMETRYFTIQETIDKIGLASEEQKIALIVKTPQDVLKLVKGGVPIRRVNIGNMHYSEGKEQLTSTVSVDEDDKKTFRELHELGVQLEIRRVPSEKGQNIISLI